MVIKDKISQLSANKNIKILLFIVVIVLAAYAAFYLYKETSKPSREELIAVSDEAGGLMAQDNYSAANEKLIEVYNLEDDEAEKAYRAFDIASNYQFEKDYDQAIEWFNTSKQHYENTQDQEGVDQVNQAIESVEEFKRLKDQPIQESPVDEDV